MLWKENVGTIAQNGIKLYYKSNPFFIECPLKDLICSYGICGLKKGFPSESKISF